MAENLSICLTQVMDHLWFHQIILIPDPISLLITKTSIKTPPQLLSESTTTSSSSLFSSSPSNDEDTLVEQENSSPSLTQEESSNDEKEKERPTREKNSIPNNMRILTRSHSTSPPFHKRSPKNFSTRILEKSMSCRTFCELELEELKGFMDLGFTFTKAQISPKLMSLIPGLQRLGLLKKLPSFTEDIDDNDVIIKDDSAIMSDEDEDIQIEEEKSIMVKNKPYLSEAWLIKRPDSPLLNLRVPRYSAAADMKKHLKSWARIVASEIQQES